MYDYIKDHALKNVWCTPDQDGQYIFKPKRLTPINGVSVNFKVMWRNIALPDQKSRWHVYQLGQLFPAIIGLFPNLGKWNSLASACNSQKMICDIYTLDGVNLPRFETYYMYNTDRDLIIAVKENPSIAFDFNSEELFLRVYTNAYFNTVRSDQTQDFVHVEGLKAMSNTQIMEIQNNYLEYNNLPGQTYCFVNGFKTNNISLITAKVGDVVEFVYDSSIYKVVDFVVGSLNTFSSALDEKVKYLLHYAGVGPETIDYQDDIDVFVIDPYNPSLHRGVYYHKNAADAMRMVTHRDYALTVPYVLAYKTILQSVREDASLLDPNTLRIRLHIRKSGYKRPLIYENNRIFELYKMKDADIMGAMLNIESSLELWRAPNLEASGYTHVMRAKCDEVTNQLVQDAYGYNAIAKLVADTPAKTFDFSSRKVVNVPYGLQSGSTAYEYDKNGHLLGTYYHSIGSRYACKNQTADMVEFIMGYGTTALEENYGTNDVPVNPMKNYRVYMCLQNNGIPDNNWIDVTDSGRYGVVDNKIHWTDTTVQQYLMVRMDGKFLSWDFEYDASPGEVKLTLVSQQTRGSTTSNWVMQVPLGELDVFMNGKSLIKGIDYILRFPEIVIISKRHLVDPLRQKQKFHIRFTGFCTSDLKVIEAENTGFIEHGVLSNNSRFDIRDDKVLRIVVDGSLYDRSELVFAETHSGVSTIDYRNGQPYMVRDIVVPLKGLTQDNTYVLRALSEAIDKQVSDYLTLRIPQPPRDALSIIKERYQLYSPFLNKILMDLATDKLWHPKMAEHYSDMDVMDMCVSYLPLLEFDPNHPDNELPSNYVDVHPTNLYEVIDLDIYKYNFAQRVINVYMKDKVILSHFVRLKALI